MALPPQPAGPGPVEIAYVARAAVPKENIDMTMCDEMGTGIVHGEQTGDGWRLSESKSLRAHAWFVGARIDMRTWEPGETVAMAPLTVRAGSLPLHIVPRFRGRVPT